MTKYLCKYNITNNERGGVLILVLVLISVLLIIGIAQVKLVSLASQKGRAQINNLKAHYIAEAGAERVVVEYLLDEAKQRWETLSATTIWSDVSFSGGSYTVQVEGVDANTVTVHSTGSWGNAHKQLEVTYVADWNIDPPLVHRSQWREL